MLRYPCIILDHDDTVVNSTATIHYPAFNAYMKDVRPDIHMSLEDYLTYNFDPGVIPFFRDICGLSEREMKEEEAFWQNYVRTRIPEAYKGMRSLLEKYRAAGGRIAVASHSFERYIRRDYEANHLPEPDLIYGWDLPQDKRKPDPFAVYETAKTFGISPEEILVVDDLKPGHDMARAAGCPFAAAGWAYDAPVIAGFMRKNCDFYLSSIEELESLLFVETCSDENEDKK